MSTGNWRLLLLMCVLVGLGDLRSPTAASADTLLTVEQGTCTGPNFREPHKCQELQESGYAFIGQGLGFEWDFCRGRQDGDYDICLDAADILWVSVRRIDGLPFDIFTTDYLVTERAGSAFFRSSKGGAMPLMPGSGQMTFIGDEWRGITSFQFDFRHTSALAFLGRLDNVQVSAVPEPSYLLLLGAGLGSLVAFRKRRR